MNIYETFDNLRYHCEDEVVKFFANKAAKPSSRKQRTALASTNWVSISLH